MKNIALWAWLTIMAAVLLFTGLRMSQRRQARVETETQTRATSAVEPESLGWKVSDFTLTERRGEPFDTATLRGQPWVASFFFSACPGPCLKLNHTIRRLIDESPESRVPFVSITVDPRNDTPEKLCEYAALIKADSPRWKMLTGVPEEIERVAEHVFKVPAATATHSDRLILVSADGSIVGYYHPTDGADFVRLQRKLVELEASGT